MRIRLLPLYGRVISLPSRVDGRYAVDDFDRACSAEAVACRQKTISGFLMAVGEEAA